MREYHLDVGDVELAVVEWPGSDSAAPASPVMLLHATGFHSRCWNQVVKHLSGRHVFAVDLRYHGNSGSTGEADWNVLANDISVLVERLDLHDIIGVGHSVGGYMIARAAAAHRDRFKQLVLIDPVITAPETYEFSREMAAKINAEDHPVARRRNRWQDANEMYLHFKDREPFSTWQTDVLRDYCDYALQPATGGDFRQLLCDPANEASVYTSQAYSDAVLQDLPRLHLPIALLRAKYTGIHTGDFSNSPTWPELASALPDCEDHYLPQLNHFIPMQDPALVAKFIEQALLR